MGQIDLVNLDSLVFRAQCNCDSQDSQRNLFESIDAPTIYSERLVREGDRVIEEDLFDGGVGYEDSMLLD